MSQINLFAGMGAHQSARSETDSWFTPPALIEALGGAESFDLDPCSHAGRPWPTARTHYTVEDNGLLLPWQGRVWLNPPYSVLLLARFLARMAAHGTGTALIFARTETDAFFRHVWGAASALMFLRGRLTFHTLDGRPAPGNGGAPSVLIAYGAEDRDILAAAPIDGAFVPLRLPLSVLVSLPEAPASQSWREVVAQHLEAAGGPVTLGALYRAFVDHPKSRANQHWRAKVRQVLQQGPFRRVEKGVWCHVPDGGAA